MNDNNQNKKFLSLSEKYNHQIIEILIHSAQTQMQMQLEKFEDEFVLVVIIHFHKPPVENTSVRKQSNFASENLPNFRFLSNTNIFP